MAALGLPLALLLGLLADLVAAPLRRRRIAIAGGPVSGAWSDLRGLVGHRDAAGLLEAAGALVALFGCGLAGAAAVGAAPGSLPLLYLSLAVAAAGAHLATSVFATRVGLARSTAGRREAALAEVSVVVALGAAFLRWDADGLRAVWGAQEVLGSGFQVGPPAAAAALWLAAAVLVGAGALRLPPVLEARRRRGRSAGSALLVRMSRWGLSGAMSLLVAALLAGRDVVGTRPDAFLLVWALTAVGAAILLGATRAGMDLVGGRRSWAAVPAAVAGAAAIAAALAVVA